MIVKIFLLHMPPLAAFSYVIPTAHYSGVEKEKCGIILNTVDKVQDTALPITKFRQSIFNHSGWHEEMPNQFLCANKGFSLQNVAL